ncbi:GTPase [Aquimarina sp. 2201CG5-10]|uniref:GTPase n=1 Tax=Aquimarina callyspongiae TaxID=3098150 RepID=UPI002AB3850B|nr:GTPase [Aquimarina sp. 2201CG5-10]MDY8136480.1 GTPase [Aquimarina sp. 2201CG5-10]
MKKTLVFVYNAKSGFWNKSIDIAHKIISPSTYSCSLCRLTHGNFSEKKAWKDFRKNTLQDVVFIYKDEYLNKYSRYFNEKEELEYPFILQHQKNNEYEVLVTSKELSELSSIDQLILMLRKKIS